MVVLGRWAVVVVGDLAWAEMRRQMPVRQQHQVVRQSWHCSHQRKLALLVLLSRVRQRDAVQHQTQVAAHSHQAKTHVLAGSLAWRSVRFASSYAPLGKGWVLVLATKDMEGAHQRQTQLLQQMRLTQISMS